MAEQHDNAPAECQNAAVLEEGEDLNAMDIGRIWAMRIFRSLQRRITRLTERISQNKSGSRLHFVDTTTGAGSGKNECSQAFKIGDIVEVLSYEEIRQTLDEKGKCEGLEYMEGMKAFCGMRLPVKRKVTRMYDERSRRMLKMKKGRYILNDAICDGRGMYDREGCDRCCFYFWSDRWLRKVE